MKLRKILIMIITGFLALPAAAQTISYTYDKLGRVMQVTYPDSSIINYTYDAAGNRISTSVKDKHYRAPQTIKFDSISAKVYGVKDFAAGATASSGLPVSYLVSDTTIVRLLSGKLHVLKTGSARITAFQIGNASFLPSDSVSRILIVAPAPLVISAGNLSKIVGQPNPPLLVTYSGFVNGEDSSKLTALPVVSTVATIASPVSSYPIIVSGASSPNYSITYVAGQLTIKPVPPPVITSVFPLKAMKGDTISITGSNFSNADTVSFGGIQVQSFKVVSPTLITAVVGSGASGDVVVKTPARSANFAGFSFVFSLPANNFAVSVTSATCKGTPDGAILITASQSLDYNATVTGGNLSTSSAFSTTFDLANLAAGTYHVCITVSGQADYRQCYDLVVSEPKDLAVYTAVNDRDNQLTLNLRNGGMYYINLNGNTFTTKDSTFTLALRYGANQLSVTTDKLCQGAYQKVISVLRKIVPYPDPFTGTISFDLGSDLIASVNLEVHSVADGRIVYTAQYQNVSGIVNLDLGKLREGAYALHVSLDHTERIIKIVKQ